ncbi:TetR/AcrR family transcriptional regulator [Microbaculum marinum]|uniref:TetR/AcrR family transcriptional regulator n=1 Tax=Microbaculum marinum TaxID=1764581 RepID=A0AAW9RA28_9HYPH
MTNTTETLPEIEDAARRTPPKSRRGANNTRKELVRERLLEKSAELFCANGFSKTSINDIADSLSLKRSSVYHYFQNKEEIIRELFIEEYERRCSQLLDLFEREDLTALERLVLAVEGAITQRLKGGSRFLVFDRLEADVPEDLRVSYNRSRRQILDLYTRLITEGIEADQFRAVDPQLTAFAVIGMSNWTALWYSPGGRMSPNEIAKALVNLLVRGIEKRDGDREEPHSIASAIGILREDLASLERLAGMNKS